MIYDTLTWDNFYIPTKGCILSEKCNIEELDSERNILFSSLRSVWIPKCILLQANFIGEALTGIDN